jgi:hypothetical protein
VSCLACHTRPGLLGSPRYVPTLVREGAATLTGWHVAGDVLEAVPCQRCHDDLTTGRLRAAHADASKACTSCHGDVSHPPDPLLRRPAPVGTSAKPHPANFNQIHGEAAVQDPSSCATCHQTEFCQACHFKSNYPHPDGWISKHGPAQEAEGPDACTLCHAPTFCAGCHGTEIPHRADWLGEHWRALQGASTTPCLVCHPKTDCTTCHAEHGVHIEQGLYAEPPP